MRIPVKSETDAFRLALGIAVVIGAAIAVGLLAGGLYGVVLFGGAVVGAMAWELTTEDPDRSKSLRDAASAAPVDRGDHDFRVLVIANETVVGRELRSEILQGGRRPAELRVVCPILPTRAHLIASDIDRELADARERLDENYGNPVQGDLVIRLEPGEYTADCLNPATGGWSPSVVVTGSEKTCLTLPSFEHDLVVRFCRNQSP
jgi:hypothetical protein